MDNFEKLGAFYLGKEYDIAQDSLAEEPLLYDSKDLTTHAVCIGMTGSGKTGLCVGLLEEAAIDGVPALVIDPKGDLSNLMLTFEGLKQEEFEPWVNPREAEQKGKSTAEFAADQARLWRDGLAKWGQQPSRITRLKESAEFDIYTPGSSAGRQISILRSFDSPQSSILEDPDLLSEHVSATVGSLLGLLGIEADPLKSREHILISSILRHFWNDGVSVDLMTLIQAVQDPPVERIGVFELESFFPSRDRFELAMSLNNLLAAPGFQSWLEGEELSIDNLLYSPDGKPRISIFSIAHLNDSERMFFVSLLLTRVLGWTRRQSGTSSLRAILYMDEIFGFLPPVANPPSKKPLLTLLKQARAFGLGVVLATQNPVDLDYKGLSNIGTWFIGRLQTERDKARVLDGLEGIEGSGGMTDRKQLDSLLSSLGKRVFLLNNVHEDGPVTFRTRWVMSYLRGPMTRNQIKELMADKKLASTKTPHSHAESSVPGKVAAGAQTSVARPVLPPGVPEFYLPVDRSVPDGTGISYVPGLIGLAEVYYADARAGIASSEKVAALVGLEESVTGALWDDAQAVSVVIDDLEDDPDDDATAFGAIPDEASRKRSYTSWARQFKEWLYRNRGLDLWRSPSLKEVSQPDESERDFRIRLQQKARELRDVQLDKVRRKYAGKIARLEDRISRAERAVQREVEQAKQQKIQTAVSLGSTILGALFGRKTVSRGTVGRASTTVGRAGRIYKEKQDIERARANVKDLQIRLADLKLQMDDDVQVIRESTDPLSEELVRHTVRPRKKDIAVSLTALVWMPFATDDKGVMYPVWYRADDLPGDS